MNGGVRVEDHFGLALRLARRRWRMHDVLPRQDYEQEALLALVIAREKFDADRPAKFATYAYHCIEGALINAERAWLKFSRRTGFYPLFVGLRDDHPARGMSEADLDVLDGLYTGEWFARLARLYLFDGLSVRSVAELCNCRANTVHAAVSTFRKRLKQDVA